MADFTVSSDLDTFMQSADKPAMRTNMDLGTAATKDVAATGDAAAGEVVKGDDTRLTDARTPTSHTHTASEVTDFDTEVANNSTVAANTSKLAGIEAGAEVNNISDTNATDLTDGGDSTLHYHSADRSRANHTGTQTLSTISDAGTAATKDVPAAGDAAAGEVVLGNDSRLTDARTPTAHTHTAAEITDFDTEVSNNTDVAANTSKLSGIEAGAEVNNISDTNATDLTDGGDSTLHYHSADRNRANHTGTQTLSTISDAGTIASQNANSVTITGGSVTGITDLAVADGGTGASTAAAARTNLEVYSDAEVDAKVATKAVAGGVELDGTTTTYFEIPTTSIGNIFTSEGSFSFYAKLKDLSLNHTIFDCRNSSAVGGFGIFYRNDGKIRLLHETSGTVLIGEAELIINENEWFHCVITHDGTVDSSAPIFFLNGVQLVTSAFTTASGTIGTVPSSVGRFGEVVTGSSSPLLGSIKNPLFFNRALTATEVQELYESGTVAVADRWGVPGGATGCIADLPLDEGIGYQFHDRSSNHFDALASTTGVTHLVPKTEGYIRDFNVDAYNGGSGNTELIDSSRDILPKCALSRITLLNQNAAAVTGTLNLKRTAGGSSQYTVETYSPYLESTPDKWISSYPVTETLGDTERKNIALTASDSDAIDLDVRIDYKLVD
jgi:hypothetical protein